MKFLAIGHHLNGLNCISAIMNYTVWFIPIWYDSYDMASYNLKFWVQFWFYKNKLSTKLGRSFRFFSLSGSLFFVGSEFFSSELELCGTISSRRFFSLFILRVERRIPLQMVLLQCSIRLFVRPFRTAFQFTPSELIFGVLISIYKYRFMLNDSGNI